MVGQSRRGSTRTGVPTRLPRGMYSHPSEGEPPSTTKVVHFSGEDGRARSFDFNALPLPEWHSGLAAAFDARCGPSGSIRTFASAEDLWGCVVRFVRFVSARPRVPQRFAELDVAHIDAFVRHRSGKTKWGASGDLRDVRSVLLSAPIRAQLKDDVVARLLRSLPSRPQLSGPTTYSQGEWQRLIAAARSDVAAIRDRHRRAKRLLEKWRSNPTEVDPSLRKEAALLDEIDRTGVVPRSIPGHASLTSRSRLAAHQFLVLSDLAPIFVLFAALAARNSETIKELSATHTMLSETAIQVDLIKRRRGPGQWSDTVAWEIGDGSRQLFTPGGLYRLLLELTELGRRHLGSEKAFVIWANGHREGVLGDRNELRAPFASDLAAVNIGFGAWIRGREAPVWADPAFDGDDTRRPLTVRISRVKNTADWMRTKKLGGHLPSAARSNTMNVLFSEYLRPDAGVREWAGEIIAAAVGAAERDAVAAHLQKLSLTGGNALRVAPDAAHGLQQQTDAALSMLDGADGPWTACADYDHNPVTGDVCGWSFLDCFSCGNCLIHRRHLPGLLALARALEELRTSTPDAQWWARYGPAWVAITRGVLPRFTPAEVLEAKTLEPVDVHLDLALPDWTT